MKFPSGIFGAMKIAILNLCRPNIVIQYPKQRYTLPPRARWALRMKLDENGNHKCAGCMLCERACPDFIINIEVESDEERNKTIKRWEYQQGACMMCGLCVEVCNFDAIEMSHEYELAHASAEELTMDLLVDVPVARKPRPGGEANA